MLSVELNRDPRSAHEGRQTFAVVAGEAHFEPSEADTTRMQEIAMQIRPLRDHVMVKPVYDDEQTQGGLVIPDTAKEKPFTGTVIEVGNGRLLKNGKVRPPIVRVGDRVMFVKHAGDEVTLGGAEHVMLREDDILGVIEQ